MPRICYVERKFSESSLAVIAQANRILDEYAEEGLDLTLRQLYYQFVSRDLIANKQSEYKRLGSIINDARLAGLVDWARIEDRTRYLRSLTHWRDPGEIVDAAARGYRLDRWAGQAFQPEVWIEKDALVGVIEGICNELDVPFFACRGYTSQSEAWRAGQRLLRYREEGREPYIFHLGDHDPSGVDMTRDIVLRLTLFTGAGVNLTRLALNRDQVDHYGPPPNPAKLSDSRAAGYIAKHGSESWELDALEPRVIRDLISNAVVGLRDRRIFDEVLEEEQRGRALLNRFADRWETLGDELEEDDHED